MLVVGLTGSIGMGKSTTAEMFRAEGVPVYDSDFEVRQIYDGPAAAEIERVFPGTTHKGSVDRAKLSARVVDDPEMLRRLECIVHPLVLTRRESFLAQQRARGVPVAVLDIPLLFEIGAEKTVDKVVVVTAPEAAQNARVMARPGMSEEKFRAILARQTPDAEKRRRADYVIETDKGLDAARARVKAILADLAKIASGGSQNA
jgi:dephospho-CoA kinase